MLHPTQMPAINSSMPAEQLQSALTAALADDQRTEDILRERARIPAATLNDRRFREVYITADQAVEFGLAHDIVEFALPEGNEIKSDRGKRCMVTVLQPLPASRNRLARSRRTAWPLPVCRCPPGRPFRLTEPAARAGGPR